MANRAIKYRIYPSEVQKTLFAKTFGCCRKVYNLMLSDKIAGYQNTGKFPVVTPARYKEEYPFLKEVDSLALANVQLDLQKAFRNHFDKTRKARTGFPAFKSSKRSRQSYTTNNQHGTVALVKGGILLPKTGTVKAKLHRLPGSDWILKSVTVSQESDGKYYASVLFEYEESDIKYIPDISNAVGLDYSSSSLFIDSNGNTGSNNKYYRKSQDKLAKAQRKLSRMIEHNISCYRIVGNKRYPVYKKGLEECKNIQKQMLKVAKVSRHIANRRNDNLHKLSAEIANQYDVVCVENLNMRSMSNKGFGNGKATLDNGYGMFLNMLEYKLYERGKLFIKVDKWYPSSQICNDCGYRNPLLKDLGIREWDCPVCGASHDRDINAAKNILDEGLRLLKETA